MPPPPLSKRGKRSSCSNSGGGDRVIAASAGLDNWKTWAGRAHGDDTFELLDLARGFKRSFNKRFVWGVPSPGTACPVCYVEPKSADEWHCTSSCGHSVCIDCLRAYAANQVSDPDHNGPLKCPVCPLPLRESDAVRALEHSPDVIRQWDTKMRDQLLRALPNYRHCPNCEGQKQSDESASSNAPLAGGGFVTPECLAPINARREQEVEDLLSFLPTCGKMLIGGYFLHIISYASLQTNSVFAALLNAYILPAWLLHRLKLICYFVTARFSRKILDKPIAVGCPCCDQTFILNAEAELSPTKNAAVADKATAEWIGNNTRPCPSCSVPISKSSGCNHMRCSHCRASFCWACMRPRTRCAAYACTNGAPYGNSVSNGDEEVNAHAGGIVQRIERLERHATRLQHKDVAAFLALYSTVFWRNSAPMQFLSHTAEIAFSVIFSSGFIFSCVLLVMLLRPYFVRLINPPRQRRERVNARARDASICHREREMLVAAIARSLLEQ